MFVMYYDISHLHENIKLSSIILYILSYRKGNRSTSYPQIIQGHTSIMWHLRFFFFAFPTKIPWNNLLLFWYWFLSTTGNLSCIKILAWLLFLWLLTSTSLWPIFHLPLPPILPLLPLWTLPPTKNKQPQILTEHLMNFRQILFILISYYPYDTVVQSAY